MNFVFGELSAMRRMRSEDAEGAALAGDSDGDPADNPMIQEQRGSVEAPFAGQVLHHNRLPGCQSKPRLGGRIGRHRDVANRAILPAYTRAQ